MVEPPRPRIALALLALVVAASCSDTGASEDAIPDAGPAQVTEVDEVGEADGRAEASRSGIWSDPVRTGAPYGDTVDGVLTFRGNPSRTYHGEGPVPDDPEILWSFPGGAMCSESSEGGESRTWCGTGWTGQPAVWEPAWDDTGGTWVAFGAYDRNVHFLDAASGERRLPDFATGDLIKGSVTVDPDGFPLLYTGSRDDNYRVIALDRDEPTELYALNARDVSPTMWNDDWDGSGLVIDDHLLIGGENSRFHVVKLNRSDGNDGLVTVDPEVVFHTAGWDDELLGALGDRNVSIENSVAVHGSVVYFANSGGLVQGWDLAPLTDASDPGEPERVFRFWTGDDVDASVVVDEDGMLYVGAEWERHTERAREVGQIVKLDPSADDPLVWSVADDGAAKAGVWGTPAIHRDLVIVPTHTGRLLGIDRADGAIRWEKRLPGPVWQSPVVVDDVLVQGDCGGVLHAYDVSDTSVDPPQLWELPIGGCIESTPVVWKGRIYVGTRGGFFHAIG